MAQDNSTLIFLAGLGVGVVGTLLFAPWSGEESRTLLKNNAGKARDYLKDKSAALADVAKDKVEVAGATAKVAQDKAKDKSKDFAHAAGEAMQGGGKRLQEV